MCVCILLSTQVETFYYLSTLSFSNKKMLKTWKKIFFNYNDYDITK
jgi:hypothetical protein